jgi:HSP20 family protein
MANTPDRPNETGGTATPATQQQPAGQPSAQRAPTQPVSRWTFDDMQRQMDRMMRLFDDTFSGLGLGRMESWPRMPATRHEPGTLTPAMNVTESKDAYHVSADLPGMDEKDIDLSVANGVLTVKGERKDEQDRKEHDWHVRECRVGRFMRTLRLPEDVDAGSIAATFRNGVLDVTLPKRAEARPQETRIEINKS